MDAWTLLNAARFGVVGLAAGIFVGAVPGLNAAIGIALLLPFTFTMDPTVSLIFLGAVFTGGIYGGAITAIIANVPGAPSNIATCFDGYPMAQKGRAQEAIYSATIAHSCGGVIGILALLFLAPPLAQFALKFGPAESFWTYIFGLTIVASLAPGALLKGVLACLCGLLLSTVGLSPVTGIPRFTFGFGELVGGVNLIAALLGFFGFAQGILLLEADQSVHESKYRPRPGVFATVCGNIFRHMRALVLGSAAIGLIVGVLPGAGASVAALVAYAEAKNFSKHRQKFGTGIPEGVVAPEAANSACVGGDLIPTLTLGIPGSPAAAVMVGGLIVHGLVPGPALFTEHASVTYNFMYGMLIAQLLLVPMGCLGATPVARTLNLQPAVLGAAILVLSVFGAYAATSHVSGVMVMLFCGLVTYSWSKLDIPVAPAVLGLILGRGIEDSFMTSLQLGDASGSVLAYFFTRPIAVVLILLCVASFAASLYLEYRVQRKSALPKVA